ncbi:HTTM domain-containing protein [Rhodocytophaga aerolata]|uniref:HTTM domain-containing protein n=1 Tax=Rhodocytophaga aerolata TaxID=455078 RepID=A0ABT8R1P7_9BACT|nr:HTTM domain-containing protein [Rhodocytophaga aerolata]MDO1446010.1 HTTM domain-containing protein [Rhodocytophaga aerolata]
MAHSDLFTDRFHYVLLSLAAVYVIFKPSIGRLVLLITMQLVDIVYTMPATSNHWLFTAFVNLTIVQALIYLIIKNRRFQIREDEFFETFAPVIRIEVIILYFYAVFHKLNSGFFTPESSCATDLLKAQHLDLIFPLSPEMFAANAYFTLVVEATIPLFLCFKRTRNWGILLGLIFHWVLGYSSHNAFYDFSSMIFATYFLFASYPLSSYLTNLYSRIRHRVSKVLSPGNVFGNLAQLISFWLVGMAIIFIITKVLAKAELFYLHIFWTGYSLVCIGLVVVFMISHRRKEQIVVASPSFAVPHPLFYVLPVMVFLNGLSPYIGLKTENSFAMFSNLRTEGNISNHYIIPASFQIFDFQKDMVEILSSSDRYLQANADSGKLMVYFDFKNYVAHVKPQKIEYIRNGQRHTFLLKEASPNHALLTKNIVLEKLLRFRRVSKDGAQPCLH